MDEILRALVVQALHEYTDPFMLSTKAMEEMGEWAKDLMCLRGAQLDKDNEVTDIYGELADTIMVMLTATVIVEEELDHDADPDEIVEKIKTALGRKFCKYKELMGRKHGE